MGHLTQSDWQALCTRAMGSEVLMAHIVECTKCSAIATLLAMPVNGNSEGAMSAPCPRAQDALAFARGEIAPEHMRALLIHLGTCTDCRAMIAHTGYNTHEIALALMAAYRIETALSTLAHLIRPSAAMVKTRRIATLAGDEEVSDIVEISLVKVTRGKLGYNKHRFAQAHIDTKRRVAWLTRGDKAQPMLEIIHLSGVSQGAPTVKSFAWDAGEQITFEYGELNQNRQIAIVRFDKDTAFLIELPE